MRIIFYTDNGDLNTAEVDYITYIQDEQILYLEVGGGYHDFSLEMSERQANELLERIFFEGSLDLRSVGQFSEEDDEDDD